MFKKLLILSLIALNINVFASENRISKVKSTYGNTKLTNTTSLRTMGITNTTTVRRGSNSLSVTGSYDMGVGPRANINYRKNFRRIPQEVILMAIDELGLID